MKNYVLYNFHFRQLYPTWQKNIGGVEFIIHVIINNCCCHNPCIYWNRDNALFVFMLKSKLDFHAFMYRMIFHVYFFRFSRVTLPKKGHSRITLRIKTCSAAYRETELIFTEAFGFLGFIEKSSHRQTRGNSVKQLEKR
jgi:hypothetical protein